MVAIFLLEEVSLMAWLPVTDVLFVRSGRVLIAGLSVDGAAIFTGSCSGSCEI